MKRLICCLAMFLACTIPSLCLAMSNEVYSLMGSYAVANCAFATTDTSQALNTAYDAGCTSDPTWASVRAVTIQAVSNDVVISIGTDAVAGASQVGFTLVAGASVRFVGMTLIRQLNVINHTSGTNARINVLVEY